MMGAPTPELKAETAEKRAELLISPLSGVIIEHFRQVHFKGTEEQQQHALMEAVNEKTGGLETFKINNIQQLKDFETGKQRPNETQRKAFRQILKPFEPQMWIDLAEKIDDGSATLGDHRVLLELHGKEYYKRKSMGNFLEEAGTTRESYRREYSIISLLRIMDHMADKAEHADLNFIPGATKKLQLEIRHNTGELKGKHLYNEIEEYREKFNTLFGAKKSLSNSNIPEHMMSHLVGYLYESSKWSITQQTIRKMKDDEKAAPVAHPVMLRFFERLDTLFDKEEAFRADLLKDEGRLLSTAEKKIRKEDFVKELSTSPLIEKIEESMRTGSKWRDNLDERGSRMRHRRTAASTSITR